MSQQKQEVVDSMKKKFKNQVVAYDYNGNLLYGGINSYGLPNKRSQGLKDNQVNIGYNVSTPTQKLTINNNDNMKLVEPKFIKHEPQKIKSSNLSMVSQETLVNQVQPNNGNIMFENFKPAQGVALTNNKGLTKKGDLFTQINDNMLNSDQNLENQNQNSTQQKVRMTKKEYEDLVKVGGNYLRSEFKFQTQNSSNNNLQSQKRDILDEVKLQQNQNNKKLVQLEQNPSTISINENTIQTQKKNNGRLSPKDENKQNGLRLAGASSFMKNNNNNNQQQQKNISSKHGNINVANHDKLSRMLFD